MAVRIAGITIPNEKRVAIALTYIFGIGRKSADKILKEAKVDINTRVKALKENEINNLRNIIEKKYRVEGDLKREIIDKKGKLSVKRDGSIDGEKMQYMFDTKVKFSKKIDWLPASLGDRSVIGLPCKSETRRIASFRCFAWKAECPELV